MSEEFFLEYIRLKNQRETFATAMVVQHGNPISGKTGDKAIIRVDGSIHGWIGGGCTHPIVIEQALSLMEAGESRLITIDPESRSAQVAEVKHIQMTCNSGGSLSIYIEPVYPKPQIVVMGDSPVGQSLLQLSSNLGYETIWVSESQSSARKKSADRNYQGFDMKTINPRGRSFLIVCTQGEGDREALKAALDTSPDYLAFVGSRRKTETLKKELAEEGVCSKKLEKMVNPAGLDIKARTPQEIALSILAEIVQHLRSRETNQDDDPEETACEKVNDPVCGMMVNVSSAKFSSLFEDQVYFFCCAGCKTRFEKSPQLYLIKT